MNTFFKEQLKQYHQDGYLLLKNLFDREEIGLLHKSATADRTLDNQSYGRQDGEGGTVRLSPGLRVLVPEWCVVSQPGKLL